MSEASTPQTKVTLEGVIERLLDVNGTLLEAEMHYTSGQIKQSIADLRALAAATPQLPQGIEHLDEAEDSLREAWLRLTSVDMHIKEARAAMLSAPAAAPASRDTRQAFSQDYRVLHEPRSLPAPDPLAEAAREIESWNARISNVRMWRGLTGSLVEMPRSPSCGRWSRSDERPSHP